MTDLMPIPPALAVDAEPFTVDDLDQTISAGHDPTIDGQGDGLTDDELEAANVVPAVFRWEITDRGLAEWAMRHVAALTVEERDAVRQHQLWQSQLDDWLNDATNRIGKRRAFFESHLIGYAARLRDEDPKVKTVRLPSGTVASTAHAPAVEVDDTPPAVLWAVTHGLAQEVVNIITNVQVRELRKHVHIVDEHIATLACGHDLPEVTEPYAVGDIVKCEACAFESPVASTRTVAVAVDEQGEHVPGTRVRPASVTYRVNPA